MTAVYVHTRKKALNIDHSICTYEKIALNIDCSVCTY